MSTMFAATEARYTCCTRLCLYNTDAARSFIPCWDQPNVKCTFQMQVVAASDLQVREEQEL